MNGARLDKACSVLGFSIRTYERWKKSSDKTDKACKMIKDIIISHDSVNGDTAEIIYSKI